MHVLPSPLEALSGLRAAGDGVPFFPKGSADPVGKGSGVLMQGGAGFRNACFVALINLSEATNVGK